MQNDERINALFQAIEDLPKRHPLRKAIAANGLDEVSPELFEPIYLTALGKPFPVRRKVRLSALRALGALNLNEEQRSRAMALLMEQATAKRLMGPTVLRGVGWWTMVAAFCWLLARWGLVRFDPATPLAWVLLSIYLSMFILPFVTPLFVSQEKRRWMEQRAAAWGALGNFVCPESVMPLVKGCIRVRSRARRYALRSLVNVTSGLTDEELAHLDIPDPAILHPLLTIEVRSALVGLRLLKIHGTGSSLAAVERLIRTTDVGHVRARAGEVAEVLRERKAHETGERTYLLRGSEPLRAGSDVLLRGASASAVQQDNLLIASQGHTEAGSQQAKIQ